MRCNKNSLDWKWMGLGIYLFSAASSTLNGTRIVWIQFCKNMCHTHTHTYAIQTTPRTRHDGWEFKSINIIAIIIMHSTLNELTCICNRNCIHRCRIPRVRVCVGAQCVRLFVSLSLSALDSAQRIIYFPYRIDSTKNTLSVVCRCRTNRSSCDVCVFVPSYAVVLNWCGCGAHKELKICWFNKMAFYSWYTATGEDWHSIAISRIYIFWQNRSNIITEECIYL